MLGGAYKQFAGQFLDDPAGQDMLYYRLTFATGRRTGFGPVRVSAAEAGSFMRHFKWSARLMVTAFVLAFLVLVIALASVPGIDAPSDGSAGPPADTRLVIGYIAAICGLFVLLGIGAARAWSRPARQLAGRPAVVPDPYPADAI